MPRKDIEIKPITVPLKIPDGIEERPITIPKRYTPEKPI